MHETCYTCNFQIATHTVRPFGLNAMATTWQNTHTQLVKAANSAHMYQVTVRLYGDAFIAIRPKTAEIYILKLNILISPMFKGSNIVSKTPRLAIWLQSIYSIVYPCQISHLYIRIEIGYICLKLLESQPLYNADLALKWYTRNFTNVSFDSKLWHSML